jgi:DNA-binding CsgD family transcriptional regulator
MVFGRERELALTDTFLSSARDGPRVLLFEGEAGIGKTSLWQVGVHHARELGLRVLEARPAASERGLSFAALGDLLAGTHDEIRTLPGLQCRALRIALLLEEAEGEAPELRAVGAALGGLLRRLADDDTILIAVDDVQWLDTSSAAALQFALRRLEDEPVRVLATSRSDGGLLDVESTERIEVGPLRRDELDQLVRTRLGARFLRPTLRQLEQASRGNPFYALEVAASLLRAGSRHEPGEPLPIPARLLELVGERLATLTPAAREAAVAAAALAQPTVSLLRRATGDRAAAGVSEAVAAGILERDGEALRFTHPLLASTLYGECGEDERRDLHRRLAELVADPEEQARHLAEVASGPDEQVASALEAAATSVGKRGAPDAAARLAKHAVELTPIDLSADVHRRRLEWAKHCLAAGDPAFAENLLERQLEQVGTGRERAEVELELGTARLAIHGISAARACYERALRELEGTDELELGTRVLLELADANLGERITASDVSERAIAFAEELGKPELLARALGIHGWKLTAGEPPPAEYWRRAMEVEHDAGELRYRGPTHAFAWQTFMRGDVEAGASHLRRVADSMRRRGDPKLPMLLLDMSDAARASGAWDVAARYADEAYDLVVQTGREALEPDCVMYKARFALLHGNLELAQTQTDEALTLLKRLASSEAALAGFDGRVVESLGKSLLGRIAAMSGRHADAHHSLAADIETLRQLGLRDALAESLAEDIASLVALGELEEASRALHELSELAKMLGTPIDALAARAQGLVAAAAGDSAGAFGHLERALRLLEALPAPWPLEMAKTLLALGGVRRRARQKLAARETLERALEIFERLGARLWVEKTRAELRQLGGRPSRPDALTATEQSVANLVAKGRSNAEVANELFMSPKTVEWNLSKIYKKLHVRSRAELAAKLAKQESLA